MIYTSSVCVYRTRWFVQALSFSVRILYIVHVVYLYGRWARARGIYIILLLFALRALYSFTDDIIRFNNIWLRTVFIFRREKDLKTRKSTVGGSKTVHQYVSRLFSHVLTFFGSSSRVRRAQIYTLSRRFSPPVAAFFSGFFPPRPRDDLLRSMYIYIYSFSRRSTRTTTPRWVK